MMRLILGSICFLSFMLSGCAFIALRDAQVVSDKADMTLHAEYARYIIRMQADGAKNIHSFDKWLIGEYKNLSDYGRYYDIFKLHPELNKGAPLDYKDWVKSEPRPIAKESQYLFE